jgi:hypothetical protein
MTTTALYGVVVILLIVIIWLILSPSIATDPTLEEDGSATTFTEKA